MAVISKIINVQPGGCGEVVNTPGCEPGMREFNSHHSPQNN